MILDLSLFWYGICYNSINRLDEKERDRQRKRVTVDLEGGNIFHTHTVRVTQITFNRKCCLRCEWTSFSSCFMCISPCSVPSSLFSLAICAFLLNTHSCNRKIEWKQNVISYWLAGWKDLLFLSCFTFAWFSRSCDFFFFFFLFFLYPLAFPPIRTQCFCQASSFFFSFGSSFTPNGSLERVKVLSAFSWSFHPSCV